MKDALDRIRNEHRSLSAVVHALRDLVARIRDGGGPADFDKLRAMLYYLDAYSARLHHPQEDEFLFQPLRARGADDAVIGELEHEHTRMAAAMRSLEQALLRFEAGGEREFVAFATAVEGFCEFYLRHMRREELLVLPLAERLFSDADWTGLDGICAARREPPEGAQEELELQQLYRRIVGAEPSEPGSCQTAGPA